MAASKLGAHALRSPYGHPYHPRMLRRVGIAAALGVLALPAAADAAPGMLSIEGTFSYVEVKDSRGDAVVRRSARQSATCGCFATCAPACTG